MAEIRPENFTTHPVKAMSSSERTCVIRNDATLACWGQPQGQPPKGTFTAVSVGMSGSCAIRTDGTVTCWVFDPDHAGVMSAPPPPGTFTSVSAGDGHYCAIRTNGTLACWDDLSEDGGDYDEADYDEADYSAPVPPAGKFTAVSVGNQADCAIGVDGSLICWGYDLAPSTIDDGTFAAVSVPCAVRTNGELVCFGRLGFEGARLPTGTFSGVGVVSSGAESGCAIRTDKTLACWGISGMDDAGNDLHAATPAGTYAAVAVGWSHACAQRTDGTVVCWGNGGLPGPLVTTSPLRPLQATTKIPLRWSGYPLFTPIASYSVKYWDSGWNAGNSDDSVPFPDPDEDLQPDEDSQPITWRSATRATHGTFAGSPGHTYCFEVTSRDAEGLVSEPAWPGCTAIPLDDRSLRRSGDWTPLTGSRFYQSTALRSSKRGATLRLDGVTSSGIALLATTCPSCGSVEVRLGGELLEKVSLRSPRTMNRRLLVVFWDDGQCECGGTLAVKVVTRGKPVIIDGIALSATGDS